MAEEPSSKVLVAGGGVAGLAAVRALQAAAPGHFDVELITPQRHVTTRSLDAGPPFLRATTARVELAELAGELGFRFTRDALEAVDPGARELLTQGGAQRFYDTLILALGTRPAVAVEGTVPFRGLEDLGAVVAALEPVASMAYVARSANMWTPPLYEVALQTAAWAAHRGVALRVLVVTAERTTDPLSARLLASGIGLMDETVVERFHDGRLELAGGGTISAEIAVALPHLVGRAVSGLPPGAANGFTDVDETGRVTGVEDIYAVGDMTGSRLLAARQAGLAADAIAARAVV
ncbi:NAD(P)/FAD-dependent oxidoreductase [Solirubrobacter ginsenosidimutans]|uniref:NAD(P)/FAD-dependent oxidoreductase n=1 Tax=Solirubrobacter ginsenosidimutans TaxID=490573 RepID=A0A9X3MY20_9ACTN|nr:FAD/NAD(P)-binding oxidoreductase [Solirubrobacter ginsenosidimutans]MDA0163237.1 NAD(P)/FAD-dependent oxidoreductase [Solirubrobacter ginsenosidimutans]